MTLGAHNLNFKTTLALGPQHNADRYIFRLQQRALLDMGFKKTING